MSMGVDELQEGFLPLSPCCPIIPNRCRRVKEFLILTHLHFAQAAVRPIQYQALPGPKARAVRAKTMRRASLLKPGGEAVLSPGTGSFRCRGARSGARWARLILRKPDQISRWTSFPADAFSAHRPSFRATSLLCPAKRGIRHGRCSENIGRTPH